MAETYKVLGQLNPSAAALTALYTVPAATRTVVSSLAIANRSGVQTTYRVSIAIAGAADDPKQYLAYDILILGNYMNTMTLGVTLSAADVLRVYATNATLSFNVFGAEVT